MTPLEYIAGAVLVLGTATGFTTYVWPALKQLIEVVSISRQKKLDAQTAVAVKEAISGDVVMTSVFDRLKQVEADRDADRSRINHLERKQLHTERKVDAMCGAYDQLNDTGKSIADAMRANRPVSEVWLQKLEKAPSSEAILARIHPPSAT